MTQRIKITVEYDGNNYVGWQAQDNGPSVQQTIEEAITAFSGETVRLTAAGRTDAGVHALGQVAHFDLEKDLPSDRIRAAINAHLKGTKISITDAQIVDNEFSARFSALKRHYLYRIISRPSPIAIREGLIWWIPKSLNVKAMHDAAQVFVGKHDFTTFRHVQCQAKSPIKTIDCFTIEQVNDEIHCRVIAQSFLHSQVRSMVGTLKLVGEGKWTKADVREALKKKDRTALGFNAPPHGLYLEKVDYPD